MRAMPPSVPVGGVRSPVSQRQRVKMAPTTIWAAATLHGNGSALVSCLPVTLCPMESRYHSAK